MKELRFHVSGQKNKETRRTRKQTNDQNPAGDGNDGDWATGDWRGAQRRGSISH